MDFVLLILLVIISIIAFMLLRMVKNQEKELKRLYSQQDLSGFYDRLTSEDREILRTYMEIQNKQKGVK
jgi:hypothetical protein